MNVNQIINMVIRRVMSIAINKGINAGADQLSKRKTRKTAQTQQQDTNRLS
ncbi:hypothetical protein [Planktotalea sp.]|uniref:hypothetical protein n=1 Tax=Planktotalea sp. TaxID=2029877 RepID=UPI003D6BB4CD